MKFSTLSKADLNSKKILIVSLGFRQTYEKRSNILIWSDVVYIHPIRFLFSRLFIIAYM